MASESILNHDVGFYLCGPTISWDMTRMLCMHEVEVDWDIPYRLRVLGTIYVVGSLQLYRRILKP